MDMHNERTMATEQIRAQIGNRKGVAGAKQLRKALEKGIPYIHGAIHGTLGQITIFLSNTKSYEEMFNLPSLGKELDEDVIEDLKNVTSGTPPAIGPTPNLIGCIEAMEAYKIITGIGKVIVAPKILTFDLLDLTSFHIEHL